MTSSAARRLLLVRHRPIDQAGGPAARWRSFARHLPEHGWEVDVVSAGGAGEFASPGSAQTRAKVMEAAGRLANPFFRLAGLRPEALPLSTLWIARGAREIQRRLRGGGYDAVLATGPPFAALFAASRATGDVPLVVELRDLWAGNPAFDRGGPILRRAESSVVKRAAAVVAVTPEAAEDLRRRHPARIEEIPNGFEPELLEMRRETSGTTILHSGTLTKDRPLTPLLAALKPPLRLVLHGYVAPEIQKEIAESAAEVEIVAPSGWEDAVRRGRRRPRHAGAGRRRRDRGRREGLRVPRARQACPVPVPRRGNGGAPAAPRCRWPLRTPRRRDDDPGSPRPDRGRRSPATRPAGDARALRAPPPRCAARRTPQFIDLEHALPSQVRCLAPDLATSDIANRHLSWCLAPGRGCTGPGWCLAPDMAGLAQGGFGRLLARVLGEHLDDPL